MASMFLSYLLGIWLLLGQFPTETTAYSRRAQHVGKICTTGFTHLELKCRKYGQRDSNIHEEMTLREGSLSESPVIFSYRDVEALKTLPELNPDFPQNLKAALSDTWSVLRSLQHPEDQRSFLRAFTRLCCSSDCAKRIKYLSCGKKSAYFLGV